MASRPTARAVRLARALVALLFAILGSAESSAQTRVLPLGDSITNGGQGHASYRYALWFGAAQAGYVVDFVGSRQEIFGGDPANLAWYPSYLTSFDRDHEGYWGYRTDQIAALIDAIAAAAQPDVALIHLGTHDIGQNGAAGVANADANLRFIIGRLRAENPDVVVLLARVVPIACCSGYFANAAQVGPLNAAIDQIALDLDTPMSPVVVVDLNTGFDTGTMLQSDGLHPNTVGESWMASQWLAVLGPFVEAGNAPPGVAISSPIDGASVQVGVPIAIAADASDANGSVTQVSFFAGAALLGVDASPPWEFVWPDAPLGSHALTAVAVDDGGAMTTSAPVVVDVVAAGAPIAIPVSNASFETPVLNDGVVLERPGTVGGWVFAASSNTYLGIFDPPAGSYPSAGGAGTPAGADGENVAYLFNNGGPAEFVEATQALAATLEAGNVYELRVAIGRFLPGQPYAPSSYGGYRVELLAGSTVIAVDEDGVDPAVGTFSDALASVAAADVAPTLLGQPLSIRLTISATGAPFSTHFDDVRLTRRPERAVPALSAPAGLALALALAALAASWLGTSEARREGALATKSRD